MTTPPELPLLRDDILEHARGLYHEADFEHGDGLAWDITEIWDLAATNGHAPARPDDWADHPIPGEVMLLIAEAEEYAKT